MELILKTLHERIEQMIKAHKSAQARESEMSSSIESLKATIGDLERRLEEGAGHAGRAEELEQQRAEFAERIETVISMIDKALETQPSSDET